MFEALRGLWTPDGQRGQSRVDLDEGKLLYDVANSLPDGSTIVELGRMHGGTTIILAAANPLSKVITIDNAPTNDEKLQEQLKQMGLTNVDIVHGNTQTHPNEHWDVDMLFIDADHSKRGCLADFYHWFPRVKPGGHIVFHDASGYNSDEGCVEATNELVEKNTPMTEQPQVLSIRHFIKNLG